MSPFTLHTEMIEYKLEEKNLIKPIQRFTHIAWLFRGDKHLNILKMKIKSEMSLQKGLAYEKIPNI